MNKDGYITAKVHHSAKSEAIKKMSLIGKKKDIADKMMKQKGKGSLNRASGKDEGENMMLGRDEHNRA